MRTSPIRNAVTLCGFLIALLALTGCSESGSEGDSTSAPAIIEPADSQPTSSSQTTKAEALTVVFTNNIDGEIEPCG